MIFYYQALDRNGDNVSDYIDAPSEMSARQKIRGQGLYVVRLKKQEMGADGDTGERKSVLKDIADKVSDFISIRRSAKQVGIFSRQLATLLKAGLPLPVAITDIVDQIENKYFRNVVADLKEKLEEGSSFSNALRRHRNIFSDMYINMVRVGENLGSLEQVVERLADIEQKRNLLMGRVRSALWYPAFMFFFAVGIEIFLMINVIPRIAEMFEEQKQDLPLPTEIVIGLSNFLAGFWWLIPILIAVGVYAYKRYKNTPKGRHKIDEIKMKIPLFKNLYRKLLVYRFTQNLGVLLHNKVEIIKSFEIVEKIVGNVVVEERLSEASKKIKEGASVAASLRKSDFLPKIVLGMITVGEASDKLDEMLLNIGGIYEQEIDMTVSNLTSLLEPIVIIFMGVIIGTIVMSVMLPIMNMNLLIQ